MKHNITMENHITLVGNGTMLIDSANKNLPAFIVPHNFEIVFWTRAGSTIPDDYAANIEVSPEIWYHNKAYTKIYTVGEQCPNHSLTSIKVFNNNTLNTKTIENDYRISFCPPIGAITHLSTIVDVYKIRKLNYQLSGKIILHWCADRTIEFI